MGVRHLPLKTMRQLRSTSENPQLHDALTSPEKDTQPLSCEHVGSFGHSQQIHNPVITWAPGKQCHPLRGSFQVPRARAMVGIWVCGWTSVHSWTARTEAEHTPSSGRQFLMKTYYPVSSDVFTMAFINFSTVEYFRYIQLQL